MRTNLWIFFIVAIIMGSCRDGDDYYQNPNPPTDPVPPPLPASTKDTRTVLLKDVVVSSLPSPYFNFVYNDSGYVTNLNFASNFFMYELFYSGKRVRKMVNRINDDSLMYSYINGYVVSIRHHSTALGRVTWHYDFSYYSNGMLKQIRWFAFPASVTDSTLERKVIFTYHGDGNMKSYEDYRKDPNTGIASWFRTGEFSDYDQHTNVDDFYLLKDFMDDVLYLPQVKLQKNNSRHEVIKGVNNDFVIDYTYQFNSNNLPIGKTSDMLQTRGTGTGSRFTGTEQFSYY